jgi:hypothetical protein
MKEEGIEEDEEEDAADSVGEEGEDSRVYKFQTFSSSFSVIKS